MDTPQEKRIEDKDLLELIKSNRIRKIYKYVRSADTSVDVQRARLFTESMRETEGEALVLRWAKALYHIAEKIEVYIDDNQLLAGRIGKPGKYGVIYPELDGCFLNVFSEMVTRRKESPFKISEEDSDEILNEIYPYWKGKTYYEKFIAELPEDLLKITYNPEDTNYSRFIVNETASMRSALQWVHDYQKVLERGFENLKKDAENELEKLQAVAGEKSKIDFLKSEIIVADAIMLWAERHSKLAYNLAEIESNPERKAELERIGYITKRVPRYPAETFYEALQSQWFVQLFSRLEQKTAATISNGRMDQYLYSYYKKDIEEGTITRDEVKELLQCMWLAMAQYIDLYVSPAGVSFNEGYAHWEAVTIGGITKDGFDAVNDLSYLFLENKRELPLNYPDLAARINSVTSDRFLKEVVKTIKEGTGFPKLLNDEEIIPILVSKGASFSDANDYAVSGCAEVRMVNSDTYTSAGPYINLAAAIELTLNNGRMPIYGNELLTIETGEPESFSSWEDFLQAYLKQQKYLIRQGFRQYEIVDKVRQKHYAAPFASSLHDLCRKAKKDIHSGKIENGIDLGYFDLIGYGSVVDSLSAIKKNVYENKIISITELNNALKTNFEGQEVLRRILMKSPKYGNNDSYADEIAKLIDLEAVKLAKENQQKTGIYTDLRYVPVTSHIPFGKVIGALPNGRLSGKALSDGTSASHGADTNGPTAILISNYKTKNRDYNNRAARLLNIKLIPSVVAGDDGTAKLVSYIKTWRDLKLWHLQFNIINQETLLKAQKNPEEYKDLIIRVAGYSAFFVDLTEELQNDIIARTNHETF